MDTMASQAYPPFESTPMAYSSTRGGTRVIYPDRDRMNHDDLAITYIGDRFNEERPRPDADTLDIEDPPTSRVPRKRQAIEALEEQIRRGGDVSEHGDSTLDPSIAGSGHNPAKIRRIGDEHHALSAESLKAVDQQGKKEDGMTEWLDGSTQYAVDTGTKKRRVDAGYMLHVPEPPRGPPIPMRIPDRFQCINCKRQFSSKSELRHHARRYEARPYNCSKCPKSFLYPKDLKRHETTHSGKKTFRCGACPKSFSRKDNLRRHFTNEHTGTPIILTEAEEEPANDDPDGAPSDRSEAVNGQNQSGNTAEPLQQPGNDVQPTTNQGLTKKRQTAPSKSKTTKKNAKSSKTPPVSPPPPLEQANEQFPSDVSSHGDESNMSNKVSPELTEKSPTRGDQAMAQKILQYLNTQDDRSQSSGPEASGSCSTQALSNMLPQAPPEYRERAANGPYYTNR